MIKRDKWGHSLKTGDWVKYESIGMTYVGRITKIDIRREHYGMDNVPYQIKDDIEITLNNGNRSVRSPFYAEKITEDEAMLFMLES